MRKTEERQIEKIKAFCLYKVGTLGWGNMKLSWSMSIYGTY